VRVTSHALALHVAAHCPRLRTLTLTRCDAIDRIPREMAAQCREIEAVALPHRCANGETLVFMSWDVVVVVVVVCAFSVVLLGMF
jgi:hypothetical protein